MTEEQNEKCEPRNRQVNSVTHCFDVVLQFAVCPPVYVPGWTVPPEGRDGWDQGTTGTDRDNGAFGRTQPAEMDRCVIT